MKLRYLALSLALAASTPFAQNVVVVPAPAPDTLNPPTVVVVPDPLAPQAIVIERDDRKAVVTDHGGLTPQEHRDTTGQEDRVTGLITAPGYMGPRDTKGQ